MINRNKLINYCLINWNLRINQNNKSKNLNKKLMNKGLINNN